MQSLPEATGVGWSPRYCFSSVVLLGSDGWGTVGQSRGSVSRSPSTSPAREVLQASKVLFEGGRKMEISPPGIVLSADVTEKEDSPQPCIWDKIGRNPKAYVMKLENELF